MELEVERRMKVKKILKQDLAEFAGLTPSALSHMIKRAKGNTTEAYRAKVHYQCIRYGYLLKELELSEQDLYNFAELKAEIKKRRS